MKVPISWLKDFVEIRELPEKLAEDLQTSGNKVENIEKKGDDYVLEFEITPNRPDTLAVMGLAREIAAIYNRPLRIPNLLSENPSENKTKKIQIKVEDDSLSPSYSIGILDNIKVSTSPLWLTERLEKSGIRSINNVVDITNYVMHETGQPMHAFDFNKIKGVLRLRSSKKGELLTTLDGNERKIPEHSIVIEDEEKIIDLAGLMGGKNSEVDANTITLVLHSPLYNRLNIRRTSKVLGLRTEASNRFEKKLDPNGHRFAFERAAKLLTELGGARIVSQIKSVNYPKEAIKIAVEANFINTTLGLSLSNDDIAGILKRLGFGVNSSDKDLKVEIPTYRTDIEENIDLVEEVGRIYGYNNFPVSLPKGSIPIKPASQQDSDIDIKNKLVTLGVKEIYSSALTDAITLENAGIKSEECLKVTNRLVIDYEYLRPNLILGLLEAAKTNINEIGRFAFFEIGKVFEKSIDENTRLPRQPMKIAGLFVGYEFQETKGILETLFKSFHIKNVRFALASSPKLFDHYSTISIDKKLLGFFGDLDEKIRQNYDLPSDCFVFELDIEIFMAAAQPKRYHQGPKYPVLRENLSAFVPENKEFADIQTSISNSVGNNLYSLELIEDTIIKGKRSILLEIEYYDNKKTLSSEDVKQLREKMLADLEDLGVEPRVE